MEKRKPHAVSSDDCKPLNTAIFNAIEKVMPGELTVENITLVLASLEFCKMIIHELLAKKGIFVSEIRMEDNE